MTMWKTSTVSHGEKFSMLEGNGPVRIYFEVVSGSSTLSFETSSDGFTNDKVEHVAAAADGSVTSLNTDQTSLVLFGHTGRCLLSDPSATVVIKVSRHV